MKHRRAAALLVVGAMALSLACGGREGELTGAVFVVTRGGENVKLGLVPVNVFPEDVLRSQIERRQAQANLELATVRQAIKEAQNSADAAWKEVARLKAASGVVNGSIYTNPADPRYGQLSPLPVLDEAKLVAQAADAKLSELRERGRSLTSWQYYMDGLASPTSTTKTDADGKFTLRMPRSGRVGLSARTSRTAGNVQEDYYWLVWFSLDGKQTGQVMLSNDNLWGVSSSQAVLSPDLQEFPDPPPLAPRDEADRWTTAQRKAVTEALRRGDDPAKVAEVLRAMIRKDAAAKRGGR